MPGFSLVKFEIHGGILQEDNWAAAEKYLINYSHTIRITSRYFDVVTGVGVYGVTGAVARP